MEQTNESLSEALKTDVRRRMDSPAPAEHGPDLRRTGHSCAPLYIRRKTWRLQEDVVPASQKGPEGWGSNDKFTVVLETAG